MNTHRLAIISVLVVFAALLWAAAPALAQLPSDPAERAKVIAQILQTNAQQLTIFDRAGNLVKTVGPRALYTQPALSPDGKRLAVVKADLDKESNDIWVFDVETGKDTQITSSQSRESATSPAWSPDGTQIAYVALRGGYFSLYRRAANGEGSEELLYRNPGGPMNLTDWSMDGRYLNYFSTDLSGGGLFVLPLEV